MRELISKVYHLSYPNIEIGWAETRISDRNFDEITSLLLSFHRVQPQNSIHS